MQTIDGLEDALLEQRDQTKKARGLARTECERAEQEREHAEQATACAQKAHDDEAWWRVVYYQVRVGPTH